MTQSQLYAELNKLGLPVAYSQFEEYTEPPYIIYVGDGNSDIMADDHNYIEVKDFDIILHTNKKDLVSEALIENKLKELYIPYGKYETYIDSEKVFQVVYEISII